ncbi:MAG: nicotinate phosphoribosyltransferase [Acidobacteriaceae bacterium]|nr:nicotinate phosphoribosyltransferase [Acidobacteriaceae bacterium]MBV9778828.1 nicotinate phosphoribosyltransferase [Acidobacteriaceae bacterium]
MSAINTDLYELTMAAGYFCARKTDEVATFELSVRRLPKNRNFLVAAGLEQAVEFLLNFKFLPQEIDYLRSLAQFKNTPPEFFDFLAALRFTGDVFAVPEGTPVFANEPLAIIRAPLVEAQIVETYLLSTFAFQTSIASKAARCLIAAEGRSIVEFGSRRAHSPAAGVLAARAAYLAGCAGTSNTEAGMRFDIPVFGTAAHSWTMAFPTEEESFRTLQRLLGESTVFLLDTYDTMEGARLAARLGPPVWGVRLDSGDLGALSREVRRILDSAGLRDAKIFASNDLNEDRLAELVRSGAPIDAFGVGTELATSADAPSVSAVYKLVELKRGTALQYTAKFSDEKSTLPGAKQIYRYPDCDMIALYSECNSDFKGQPLLRPIIAHGDLLEPLPPLEKSRSTAMSAVAALPEEIHSLERTITYPVEISTRLLNLAESLRAEVQALSS